MDALLNCVCLPTLLAPHVTAEGAPAAGVCAKCPCAPHTNCSCLCTSLQHCPIRNRSCLICMPAAWRAPAPGQDQQLIRGFGVDALHPLSHPTGVGQPAAQPAQPSQHGGMAHAAIAASARPAQGVPALLWACAEHLEWLHDTHGQMFLEPGWLSPSTLTWLRYIRRLVQQLPTWPPTQSLGLSRPEVSCGLCCCCCCMELRRASPHHRSCRAGCAANITFTPVWHRLAIHSDPRGVF